MKQQARAMHSSDAKTCWLPTGAVAASEAATGAIVLQSPEQGPSQTTSQGRRQLLLGHFRERGPVSLKTVEGYMPALADKQTNSLYRRTNTGTAYP